MQFFKFRCHIRVSTRIELVSLTFQITYLPKIAVRYHLHSFQQDVLKTSWRGLKDDFVRLLEDVFKGSWRLLEDVWPRRIYWSWPRRLKDVFWRRMTEANIFVLIKTSSEDEDERRLQDVFQTSSSRWMFAGKSPAVNYSTGT